MQFELLDFIKKKSNLDFWPEVTCKKKSVGRSCKTEKTKKWLGKMSSQFPIMQIDSLSSVLAKPRPSALSPSITTVQKAAVYEQQT
jgi:hypothetical protein